MERNDEFNTWERLQFERNVLRGIAYGVIVTVAIFTGYINIIYGVMFTPEQNSQWVNSVVISVVTGVLHVTIVGVALPCLRVAEPRGVSEQIFSSASP